MGLCVGPSLASSVSSGMHKAAFAANATPYGCSGTRLQNLADSLLLISLMMTFPSQEPAEQECKYHNEVQ